MATQALRNSSNKDLFWYSRLWYFLIAVFFFFPKINIIQVSNSLYAGVKQEDLLILVFLIISLPGLQYRTKNSLPPGWLIYLPLLCLSIHLLSLMFLGGQTLFLVRYLIYFLYILVGWFCFQKGLLLWKDVKTFAGLLLFINAVVVVLQYFDFIGGFSLGTYANRIGRPIGIYSDPNELAGIALLCFPIAWFKSSKLWKFFTATSTWLLVLISDSRFSVILLAITTLVLLNFNLSRRQKRLALLVSLPLVIGCTAIYFNFSSRTSTFKEQGISTLIYTYIQVSQQGLNVSSIDEGLYDLSLAIRISNWSSAFEELKKSPFIGAGPGIFGLAADSLYLRILFESGVLGLLCAVALYIKVLQSVDVQYRVALMPVLAQCVFIDSLYFSRLGSMFWFIVGASVCLSQNTFGKQKSIRS